MGQGHIESGRQEPELTTGEMRSSDFRGDDCRLEAQEKHTQSDDP